MLRNPKLFISYAGEKKEIAQFLQEELKKKGYSVFFATQSIQVGDSFPKRIENFLKSCDGVIILISNSSLKSEWCRYEYYFSFFRGKILIPIITEQLETTVNNPLNYFQKDINYVHLTRNTPDEWHSILSRIEDKLDAVKQARRNKIIRNILFLVSITLLVYVFFQVGLTRINSYVHRLERNKLIEKIKTSNHVYTTNELKEVSNKFNNDQNLAEKLFVISLDGNMSKYARVNSEIIIGQVLTTFDLSGKAEIEDLSWHNSVVTNAQIASKHFHKGKIDSVKFDKVDISNTSFDSITLSDLAFRQCSFAGTIFSPAGASVVDFAGCKFNGCTIEMTNFLKVNFTSKISDDPVIVDASMSTFFENCIFETKFSRDKPGTMDFTRIDAVKFEEINFSNCKFVGYFDKDWFKHCGFYNCIFTDPSVLRDITVGNTIE